VNTPPDDGPERSPLLLTGTAGRGAGVRRLNRVPLLIVAGLGAVFAAAVGYTYHLRAQMAAQQALEDKKRPEAAGAAVLANAPAAGEIAARTPPPAPATKPASVAAPSPHAAAASPVESVGVPADPTLDLKAEARRKAWQDHYQQLAELERNRTAAWRSALQAETVVKDAGANEVPATAAARPDLAGTSGVEPPALPSPVMAPAGLGAGWFPGMPGGFGPGVPPTPQVNTSAARAKQAWLDRPGATGNDDYLQATLQPPLSPYEVKAGTPIQAKMIGGVNSGAPGLIVGQVTDNVYDTATGRFLLIPQGSRLVGSYDNSVVGGQTRIVVGWNRIIFPDGWSIDLGNMPGADEGGYAGFHDQVDTHFWEKIGNALLITVAGAAAQLSQPQASNGENFSPTQILAASLGQQFAILGQLYAQAGLAIPPTLEIRPGYPFVVMVRKDMILQPYVDHRAAGSAEPVSFGPVLQ
jgi:type IV secretory pathway VirB10-like protein